MSLILCPGDGCWWWMGPVKHSLKQSWRLLKVGVDDHVGMRTGHLWVVEAHMRTWHLWVVEAHMGMRTGTLVTGSSGRLLDGVHTQSTWSAQVVVQGQAKHTLVEWGPRHLIGGVKP